MASEYVTFDDLVRFHKEVIAPDLDARMDARMASIDGRMTSIDARMSSMDARISSMDGRMTSMDARFDRIDTRLEQMDRRHDQTDARLDRLITAMVSMEFRMQEGFNTVHDEIVQTRRDMFTNFDQLWTRFERISADFDPLRQGLRDAETRVTRLEKKIP